MPSSVHPLARIRYTSGVFLHRRRRAVLPGAGSSPMPSERSDACLFGNRMPLAGFKHRHHNLALCFRRTPGLIRPGVRLIPRMGTTARMVPFDSRRRRPISCFTRPRCHSGRRAHFGRFHGRCYRLRRESQSNFPTAPTVSSLHNLAVHHGFVWLLYRLERRHGTCVCSVSSVQSLSGFIRPDNDILSGANNVHSSSPSGSRRSCPR